MSMQDYEASMKRPQMSWEEFSSDGNAFAIIAKVRRALIKADMTDEAINFVDDATRGDYNNVLQTAMRYIDIV